MEDYEPVVEESEEITDHAAIPQPAFGEIDYYRGVEGEHQQWIHPVQPVHGTNPNQRNEASHDVNFVDRQHGAFDAVTGPNSIDGSMRHFRPADAIFSAHESADRTWGDQQSEVAHVKDNAAIDAVMSDRASKQTNENYIKPENAVFS